LTLINAKAYITLQVVQHDPAAASGKQLGLRSAIGAKLGLTGLGIARISQCHRNPPAEETLRKRTGCGVAF